MIRYSCSQCRAVFLALDCDTGVSKRCHCGNLVVVPPKSKRREHLSRMVFATIWFVLVLILIYITGFGGLSLIGSNSCALFRTVAPYTK